MFKKRVYICVINDLVTDARVQRHAECFFECGWDILLIGRTKKNSLPLPEFFFKSVRFSIQPEKGVLFYLVYQLRLLFYLLRTPSPDLYFSNDTDTLLPVFLASRFKKIPFFYDSHELFWEVPELQGKPIKQQIWKWIEKICIPHAKVCFTVNQSISEILEKRYKRKFMVIRNIPSYEQKREINLRINQLLEKLVADAGGRKILIYQGSGMNIQRGLEEMLDAMFYLKEEFVLWLVGGGDVWEKLKEFSRQKKLQNSVYFIQKVPRSVLCSITPLAHAGLSLDKPININ